MKPMDTMNCMITRTFLRRNPVRKSSDIPLMISIGRRANMLMAGKMPEIKEPVVNRMARNSQKTGSLRRDMLSSLPMSSLNSGSASSINTRLIPAARRFIIRASPTNSTIICLLPAPTTFLKPISFDLDQAIDGRTRRRESREPVNPDAFRTCELPWLR